MYPTAVLFSFPINPAPIATLHAAITSRLMTVISAPGAISTLPVTISRAPGATSTSLPTVFTELTVNGNTTHLSQDLPPAV